MRHRSGFQFLLVAVVSISPVVRAVNTVVDVGYAQYKGAIVDAKLGVSAWKGIQYAAPPIGDLRFAAPPKQAQPARPISLPTGPANWDPTDIVAERRVVFVQFSYRVGMYGFLSSAEAKAGGADVNAGLRDQVKLLEWYKCLINEKGCTDATDGLACLRALSESAIRSSNCNFNPNIDGELYTDSLVNLFEQGKYAKVPTIMGTCADECTKWNAPETLNTTAEALQWIVDKDSSLSNTSIAIIEDLYIKPTQPIFPNKGRYWRHAAMAVAEIGATCMTRNIQNYLARDGVPTFNYKYAVLDPSDEEVGYGAWHTVNSYAFWGTNRTDGGQPPSYFMANKPIISIVRSYWTSFFRNLDPNTDRVKAAAEWLLTLMERMSLAQSLRCDIVRPMSDNLGKLPADNAVTDLDPKLAAKLNRTSESTSFVGKKKLVRSFNRHH
ncbi:Alpha/Beta hydrolase protein [Pyrenochaeta sp. MPI-SDFR-AT-0127]|nr:Alpha/Beta hydrolase protein [Pyrenochaeta sp. MPI-SDFR-AT-0127]